MTITRERCDWDRTLATQSRVCRLPFQFKMIVATVVTSGLRLPSCALVWRGWPAERYRAHVDTTIGAVGTCEVLQQRPSGIERVW